MKTKHVQQKLNFLGGTGTSGNDARYCPCPGASLPPSSPYNIPSNQPYGRGISQPNQYGNGYPSGQTSYSDGGQNNVYQPQPPTIDNGQFSYGSPSYYPSNSYGRKKKLRKTVLMN